MSVPSSISTANPKPSWRALVFEIAEQLADVSENPGYTQAFARNHDIVKLGPLEITAAFYELRMGKDGKPFANGVVVGNSSFVTFDMYFESFSVEVIPCSQITSIRQHCHRNTPENDRRNPKIGYYTNVFLSVIVGGNTRIFEWSASGSAGQVNRLMRVGTVLQRHIDGMSRRQP